MFWILAVLCLVGSACGFGPHDLKKPLMAGLKIKHGTNIFTVGKENLVDMPLSNISASYKGYIKMNRPRLPAGFCPMQLWCRTEDKFRVCILTDETGAVAGVQFNIPCDDFNPMYNMREQGFITWTTTLNNRIVRFYAYFMLFVSPYAHERIASRDPTVLLRDTKVYYSGFNAELASVDITRRELDSIFTKQCCIDWLGNLYHYNMTKNQECSASTLSPFTALFYRGQLVGTRISVIGHLDKNSEYKGLYENFNAISAKYAVPNGPNCLYNGVAAKGGLAMTIYYINSPWKISCKYT